MLLGYDSTRSLDMKNLVGGRGSSASFLPKFCMYMWIWMCVWVRAREPPYSHLNHHDAGHLPDHLLLIGLGRNQPGLKQRLIPQS